VYRTVHTAATKQAAIGRIDDGIDRQRGDIPLYDFDHGGSGWQ
jgi:hypothetical protein